MANIFISRHPGAISWIKSQSDIKIDRFLTHMNDLSSLSSSDCVYGTLPINKVAELTVKNIPYFHLSLDIPAHLRGKELFDATFEQCNPKLVQYTVCQK